MKGFCLFSGSKVTNNEEFRKQLQAKNKYVYGLGKTGNSVKLLLDPEKLIKDEDIAAFEEMTEQNEEQ